MHAYAFSLTAQKYTGDWPMYQVWDDNSHRLQPISQTWLNNLLFLLILRWEPRCYSTNPDTEIVKGWTYRDQMALQGFNVEDLKIIKPVEGKKNITFNRDDFYTAITEMK